MSKIKDLVKNAPITLGENRIDGVFVGDDEALLKAVLGILKAEWKVVVGGDCVDHDSFDVEDGLAYVELYQGNIEIIKRVILDMKHIELLYVFDGENAAVVLIDDFPDEVSISIELFGQLSC